MPRKVLRTLFQWGLILALSLGLFEVVAVVLVTRDLIQLDRLLIPDYLVTDEDGQEKATKRFDANRSPIFVSGIKTYFKSRVYSDRGLLMSDEDDLQKNKAQRIVGYFGDSYLEALQVEEKETFAYIVEAHMRGKMDVNLINFGVGDTGTYEQFLRYKTVGEEIPITNIVLFFLPQNDVLSQHPGNKEFQVGQSYLHLPTWLTHIVRNSVTCRALLLAHKRYQMQRLDLDAISAEDALKTKEFVAQFDDIPIVSGKLFDFWPSSRKNVVTAIILIAIPISGAWVCVAGSMIPATPKPIFLGVR